MEKEAKDELILENGSPRDDQREGEFDSIIESESINDWNREKRIKDSEFGSSS